MIFQSLTDKNVEELCDAWFSEIFIYHEDKDMSLTRIEVLLAAEELQKNYLSKNGTNVFVLLLYQQRHHFLISLLAVALQKGTIILPPNLAENTILSLKKQQPNLIFLSDETLETIANSPAVLGSSVIDQIILGIKNTTINIDCSHVEEVFESLLDSEIWLYTSGSTGEPKKVIKTWRNMIFSAGLAIERFDLMKPCYMVATVPPQHMFGLETTIFWPLFSRAAIWFDKPLFPEEVVHALTLNKELKGFLVSTPLHIKNLVSSSVTWPKSLQRLLSATAPLSKEAAIQAEIEMGVMVYEVYGSTETASIASRKTAMSNVWDSYSEVEYRTGLDGHVFVKTKGLNAFQELNDKIEFMDAKRFKLGKRNSDLIKVAGKRASLTEINSHLQAISGIVEGVFIQCNDSERLAIFVVSSLSKAEILVELRKSLDLCFLPRLFFYVPKLPRNEVGKVLYSELLKALSC